MTRTFVITIPDSPKSMNAGGGGSRQHWAKANREKQRWEELFRLELMSLRVPKGMIRCGADITIRWKYRNRRDVTNYIAPVVKPLADVLAPPTHSYLRIPGSKKRMAVENTNPRWLPDDTDEFFALEGFRFEYPPEWPYKDPRLKSELVIRLEADYEEAM